MRDTPTTSTTARRASGQLTASRWLLATAVFGAAMVLGAQHTLVLIPVVVALAAAVALAWHGAEPLRARPAATLLFWIGVGLTAFTFLQCLPMPASWLSVIAPANADVWTRCLMPLREPGPSWAPIPLDPVATRIQVLRGVAYLLAFVATVRIANRREGVTFLETAIVVTGLALAVAAWVHPVVGAERVFGIYRPIGGPVAARHIAPIINPNTLAAYLNIAICISLAQAIAPRPSVPRPISIAAVAVLLATQLWVASRGGILSMAVGALLVVWLTRAAQSHRKAARAELVVPAVLAVAGVVFLVLSASEEAWQEVASVDVKKIEVAGAALQTVRHFPLFGMGRGAFETVFPAFFREGAGRHVVFTHPENVVAQWATEWGPLSLVAGAGILFALRPRSALVRSPPVIGAWAAVACVALHNLVDFSSELPAVVLALVVCGGIIVAGSAGTAPESRWEGWSRAPRGLSVALLTAAALGGTLVVPDMGGELYQDRQQLRAAALDASVNVDEFHAEVRAAMLRHPAEPYMPFAGALHASRARDESVVPWVERTLERAAVYGPAHLLLARELARINPSQARLEYRLAMAEDDALYGLAVSEGLRLVSGFYDVMDLAPDGTWGTVVLDQMAAQLGPRLPATRARVDEQLRLRHAPMVGPVLRAAADARADLHAEDAAPWCAVDRVACVTRSLALADRAIEVEPTKCASYAMRASILVEAGDPRRAMSELEEAADHVQDRTVCLKGLAAIAVQQKDGPRATAALDNLGRMGCATDAECLENLVFVAQMEEQRGNARRALAFYQRARERAPQSTDLLARVAGLSSSAGLHAEALGAYHDLERLEPDQPAWPQAVMREQKALVHEVLPR